VTGAVALALLLAMDSLQDRAISTAQDKPAVSTLRGTVVDSKTAKPVESARVVLVELGHPVLTGADGRFEFKDVPARVYTLNVSLIGYSFVARSVTLEPGVVLELTVPLSEGTGSYQETVTVKAGSATPAELGVSSQATLGSAALQDLRGIAADDPMRAMQALPGVATGNDFQAQFSMRGFTFRQVGLVMDGTATPLLLHQIQGEKDTGSVAMVNSDVLSQATLFAGPHPLKDGDWLGSSLSFEMREGSRDRTAVRVAVSGTSASAVAEGPVGRAKKGSWLVSIRKSYIDWLIGKIDPEISSTIGFSDTQGKFAYDLTTHQHLEVSFVAGIANYDQPTATTANALRHATSRGGVLSLAWRYAGSNWIVSQRASYMPTTFLNTGAAGQEQGRGNSPAALYRADAARQLNRAWTVEFGGSAQAQRQDLVLRNFSTIGGKPVERVVVSGTLRTTTSDAWGQLVGRGKRGGFAVGARVENDTFTARTVAAPWLLLEWHASRLTFRAGAGSSHQFPSLDIQATSPAHIGPEGARSLDAGLEHAIGRGVSWQVTGWARCNSDVIRPIGEARVVNGKFVPASAFPQFRGSLNGPAQGVDVMVSRRSPTGVTGWIAYTYAHTRFHDPVSNETFDGDFDQRHTLNMFVEARLSYRLAVNARWRYGSNFPLVGYFTGTMEDLKLGSIRNQVRLPAYSRLDVRANRTFTFDKRRLTLFIEVMNVLNHSNVAQFTGSVNSVTLVAKGWTQDLIPRVPSAGILIEF
jgi:hypothetical protein